MATNLCPACGPVEEHLSSRYCMQHLKELLAGCIDTAADRRAFEAEPAEWLASAAQGRRAA